MLIELKDANIRLENKLLLESVDFKVDEGEFVYIIGKVGSGKSSLIKTLIGEIPMEETGSAKILGHNLITLKRRHIPSLRRNMGIIFQDFQLLTDRTIYSNLDFVLQATGWKSQLRPNRIKEVLSEVKMTDRAEAYPHELSGGEQQRIAIARALLNSPKLILADEPTGNLDHETSIEIMELLRSLCERGAAIVMITHNLNLLQRFPGIVYNCENGKIKDVSQQYNNPISFDEET